MRLLPLSNLTITLGKSTNYLRLVCLIHVFAIVVLLNSSWSIMLQVGMVFVLMISIAHVVSNRTPEPAFLKLSYHANHWLLHTIRGQEIKYEYAYISFDAGLFVILTLVNDGFQKKLVVFIDQLTTAQYRSLYIMTHLMHTFR